MATLSASKAFCRKPQLKRSQNVPRCQCSSRRAILSPEALPASASECFFCQGASGIDITVYGKKYPCTAGCLVLSSCGYGSKLFEVTIFNKSQKLALLEFALVVVQLGCYVAPAQFSKCGINGGGRG